MLNVDRIVLIAAKNQGGVLSVKRVLFWSKTSAISALRDNAHVKAFNPTKSDIKA